MEEVQPLRLPKSIASDPRAPLLIDALSNPCRRLWAESPLKILEAHLDEALQEALRTAFRAGRVVRSLEKTEALLAAEAHGQRLADHRSGIPRGVRISRLLVLADDGAERFYRQVAALLERHGPRLVAVRLDVGGEKLGRIIFGSGQAARLIMVEHKEAVGMVLLSLADQWADAASDLL
jgi:hypothetical protein